ncbi:hypothetical protein GCM10010123_24170 [Pilimelia anulata]|uniref:DUF7224 domain-containing protein n=1 Tax=Pilimelia anulata TaxID=53371 RepID=A0A8J3B3R0_9ACTN|nr:hypothetical protein [Pilimelia anulata]GGJ93475.1 hypothetical protein GCM10010123_24170 [Pilimelia anulata]
MLVLDLAVLLLRGSHHWIGSWPATGAAAQLPAFFLSMLAAGAAAWSAGSTTRHRLEEQLTAASKSRVRSEAYRLCATLILMLIPYLAGQALAFGLTAWTFPSGLTLWFGYFLMGTTLLLLSTAWGWLFGKHLGAAFAAVCASLSWVMAVLFFLMSSTDGIVVVSGPVWQQVDNSGALVRTLTAIGLCVAVVWIPDIARRKRQQFAPLYSLTLVVAVCFVIGNTTGIIDRKRPANPLCTDGAVTICLWPEHEKYLPMVQAISNRIDRLPEGFALPTRLQEKGVGPADSSDDQSRYPDAHGEFLIIEGSRWSVASSVSTAIVKETFANCDWGAIQSARDIRPDAIASWTEWFIAGGGGRDYRTSGEMDDLHRAWQLAADISRDLPPDGQAAWVRRELVDLKARYCATR